MGMKQEIKRAYRNIKRAFEESVSFPVYKGKVIRIFTESNLSWDIFKRLVDSVCSI